MERKDFLKNSLSFVGISAVLAEACRKTASDAIAASTVNNEKAAASCIETPPEIEGPYPYPAGEINNPLNRSDVTGNQTGVSLTLNYLVVDVNNNCAPVPGARVDIWQCNKDGYYSGYTQNGYLGKKSYIGQTWLRGFQVTDANGKVTFKTIYPGWYAGRATHVHIEVYINKVLKKTGQLAFDETVTKNVYATDLYKAHGNNPVSNSNDVLLGNPDTDLANETGIIKKLGNRYVYNYTIGLSL